MIARILVFLSLSLLATAPSLPAIAGGGPSVAARLFEILNTRGGYELLYKTSAGKALRSRFPTPRDWGTGTYGWYEDYVEFFAGHIAARNPALAEELAKRTSRILWISAFDGFRLDRIRYLSEIGLAISPKSALSRIFGQNEIRFVNELPEHTSYSVAKASFLGNDTGYLAGKLNELRRGGQVFKNPNAVESQNTEFFNQVVLIKSTIEDLRSEIELSGVTTRVREASDAVENQIKLLRDVARDVDMKRTLDKVEWMMFDKHVGFISLLNRS